MFRSFFYLILAVFLSFAGQASPAFADVEAHPALFLQNLGDVPLMPGLEEVGQEGVVFDNPEGRIVEAQAFSESLAPEAVKIFYNNVLPQFGWMSAGAQRYVREKEALEIKVLPRPDGKGTIVKFSLGPQ